MLNTTILTDKRTDNRLFINVLRGIAVFLMLWGHCIQCCCLNAFDFFENSVFRVIYSFHMPLFMLISGYLFFFSMRKRSLKDLLIHKTQLMIQPIIMCGILCFLLGAVVETLKGNYAAIFGGGWLRHLTDYWFLWSVLSASIVVGIAYKITDKWWIIAIILILGIPFVCTMPCAEKNVYMYPYFIIGFLFSAVKDMDCIKKLNYAKYVFLILFPIMMLFYRKEHYIYTSGFFGGNGLLKHMPINMYRWAIGLVGSIFVIVLLEFIFEFAKGKFENTHITRLFENLGKKSLQVYTLSCIFLSNYLPAIYQRVVKLLGKNVLAENMMLYNFLFTPLLAIAYSVGLLLIIRIFEKIKISKILFGK